MKNKYINKKRTTILSIFIMLISLTTKVNAQSFTQNFEDFTTLTDWWTTNNSDNRDTTISWFRGANAANLRFNAQSGSDTSYVACDYRSTLDATTTGSNISDWLFTPTRIFNNGDVISFYTRTMANPATYIDNLQVRFSSNGASLNVGTTSTSVGDFGTTLIEINPLLNSTSYPAVWTQYTYTFSGLAGPTSGRVAFRYVVPNGGVASLTYSYYIGVDTYSYTSNTLTSDATVSDVYTLGTIAHPYGNPHQVQATITNTGSATLTNKVVTLNVTGANTFTTTLTIPSLAAGASTVVTFAGYTSNNNGTNNVTVSVPADAIATGNSITVTQTVNTTSYNYAYGTTVDGGLGFTGFTGDIAAKFNTSSATTITSVNVNIATAGQPANLVIWDATGAGGTPGAVLYTSPSFITVAGITAKTVSPAVAVNGGFYVGLTQSGTTSVSMADQTETPVRTGAFYFQTPTGAGTWTDFSGVVDARIMIEPVFGCSAPSISGSISGTTAVCQSTTQTYSITAVAGATSYTWTLPSGWSGTSTTNSITATVGANSGTISVVANNGCGSSSSLTLPVTLTTTPATPGVISGSATPCQSSTQIYSIASVVGATSYNWTLPSGWSGTSTSNSISATVGASNGSILVSASNACGTSGNANFAITVTPTAPQPGAITGNTNFCSGTSQTYSISPVSGATSYTWTLPSGWSNSSSTTSITTITGTNSGNVTVSANNACGASAAQTLAVTVNSAATTPSPITGTSPVCPNATGVSYSVTSTAGNTYTWTVPAGATITSGQSTNAINVNFGTNGGPITVTATNSCGTSSPQTFAVTMGSAPAQPGSISGNSIVCSSTNQTYSVPSVAGVTYSWTLPSGWLGASNSNSINTIAGTSGGVISVIATNSCGNSIAQIFSVTVNSVPSQPTSISGSASLCNGLSGIYSVVSDPSATSYSWTLPAGFTGSSTSNSITATAAGVGGTLSVTVTNGCGTSAPQTLNVTVSSAAPAQPGAISGNNPICSSSTQTYSVNPVVGAATYNWILPSGWSGTSTTNSISITASNLGGNLSVTAANGCGTSAGQTTTITVNASPAQPGAITGNTTVCANTTQNYSITPVLGSTSYTWTLPSGWSGTSTSTSINATSSSTSGTIMVTANNSICSSPAQTLTVTVNTVPAQPGTISGLATVCSGSNQTYSITPVVGAASYNWVLPAGWAGASSIENITATAGNNGGTVSVTATNICGTSAAQTMAVSVNATPAQPGTITGNTTICSGSSPAYSIASVSGASSYTWTLPSGWAGSSSTTSITGSAGSNGGTVSVVANNGTCASAAQTLAVAVNTAPAQPTAITGSLSVCQGSVHTYSVAAVASATSYNWTLPAGATGSSSLDSIAVTFGTTGGTISVAAVNTCGSSTIQTTNVAVNPLPATPVITPSGVTLASSSATTYQWNVTGNPITGATSQFYTVTQNGFYSVTVTNTFGCTATSALYNFNSIGIAEYTDANYVTIAPNPSEGVFTIDYSLALTNNKVEVEIYNVVGERVYNSTIVNQKTIIDLTKEPKGIYFVKMTTDNKHVSNKKIIIQ